MSKVNLRPPKPMPDTEYRRQQKQYVFPWKASLPFLENKLAVLIHRPMRVQTLTHSKYPYMAVQNWCGNSFTGDEQKLSFLTAPPNGKMVCERCELLAVEAGLPSSSELVGKHVHVGKVKAIRTCCGEN